MTEPSGLLIINKHLGVTSHDIVWKVRKLFGTKRVGHTGTLDPLATGVLVILVGRAAKAAEYLSSDKKGYLATLRLGITTDTEDVTGNVLTASDALPSFDTLKLVIILALISYALAVAITYFVNLKIFKKGVNVD